MSNKIAPEGQVFVCAACGKQSKDRYGEQPISRGWDESCMLNAVLCYDKQTVISPEGLIGWKAVEDAALTTGGGNG